jgi:hypothetical protein
VDHSVDVALLAGCGLLLVAVLAVRLASRTGVPALLVYLGIGLVLGQSGLGVHFENYDLAHIDVTLVVLVVCFVFRAPVYRRARNALLLVNLAGLVVFLAFPVAPPRLLPGAGFVDIVAGSGTWGAWEAGGGVADHANELASMPSLHAAWAIWVALTVMSMTTRRSWRLLAWTHVALTCTVVIVTGNHYVIDVLAGAGVVSGAWAVAPALVVRRVPGWVRARAFQRPAVVD